MAKHTKKWILEHYECDGQMSIDELDYPCDKCLLFDWRTKDCRNPNGCSDYRDYWEARKNGKN